MYGCTPPSDTHLRISSSSCFRARPSSCESVYFITRVRPMVCSSRRHRVQEGTRGGATHAQAGEEGATCSNLQHQHLLKPSEGMSCTQDFMIAAYHAGELHCSSSDHCPAQHPHPPASPPRAAPPAPTPTSFSPSSCPSSVDSFCASLWASSCARASCSARFRSSTCRREGL